ncbi:zf-HC2 domain-containing protein [Candidatus Sumerlaeota bacterium]|nr:zf-HC2 domain-containing protein [Candidatus Sumerlaeota bacterium]
MKKEYQHYREKFEDYLLGNLSPDEKKEMEEHLASCDECRREMEKEKRLLELFQTMERKSAPVILRERALDFARKQKEKESGWKARLGAILTLPRLKIITGAAALALLVFWSVQIIRAPRPLEKQPSRDSRDKRALATGIEAYRVRSDEYKTKRAASEITVINEDLKRESELSAAPAPEISQKGIMKEAPGEEARALQAKSSITAARRGSIRESSFKKEADKNSSEAALDLKMKDSLADHPDITERLKNYGAVKIYPLGGEIQSQHKRYGFTLSHDEFKRFEKETENSSIRIVSVKPILAGVSSMESKGTATSREESTQQIVRFYSDQQEGQAVLNAPSKHAESISPKSASAKPAKSGKDEKAAESKYTVQDASALPATTPFQTSTGLAATNGFYSESAPVQEQRINAPQQPPAQYTEVPEISIESSKPLDKEWDRVGLPLVKTQDFEDSSSPTQERTQRSPSSNRLTTDESLVYVEIEVEPEK